MAVKVLAKTPSGIQVALDSYFANFKTNIPFGLSYSEAPVRSPQKKIVYKAYQNLSLEDVTFTHLLKTVADLPTPVLSNNSLTMTVANDATIDGVTVEPNDIVEISKALATTLKVAPGTWQFSDKRSLTLLNPPVYTMTTSYSMGWGWRYRVDGATGDLIGLTNFVPTNQVITQGSVKILNMVALIDGSMSSYADASSLNSGQTATLTFDAVDVRRIVLRATSDQLPGDKSFPSATLGFRNQNSAIGDLFTNIRTKTKAAQGAFTYARGSVEDWATDTTLRTISAFTLNDNGGSRGRYSIELCIDGSCRLSIGGDFPPAGSTVIIPGYLSDDFFPAIAPGEFVVVENSGGTTQWRLSRKP